MLKFTILQERVILDPKILLTEEFTNILDYWEDKGKAEEGFKYLLYVFYCCDLSDENMMRDIDYRLKPEQAYLRVFKGKKKKFTKKEQDLVDSAMDAYNFFNETSIERAGMTYDQKIDEITEFLSQEKPRLEEVLDEEGMLLRFVSNDKVIGNFAKQISEFTTYKLRAIETAKKIENTGRVRGDKGSSIIERGSFRKDANR